MNQGKRRKEKGKSKKVKVEDGSAGRNPDRSVGGKRQKEEGLKKATSFELRVASHWSLVTGHWALGIC